MLEHGSAEATSRVTEALKYRREAAEIRKVLSSIQDEQFREQLSSIANQYDAAATAIENHGRSQTQ